MDWIELLKRTIDYIEKHMLDLITVGDIAKHLNISSFYLQKGFRLMTGFSISEYIRNRRLYLAALDLLENNKVIDIAYKYGYETPESFTKAFKRFHGISPAQIKTQAYQIKQFLPLSISIVVSGGNKLSVTIEQMDAFQVIGIEREYSFDSAYDDVPQLWEEYCKHSMYTLCDELPDCHIGMYGISIDIEGIQNRFNYLVAGDYHGEKVPEGLKVIEIPSYTWAKFHCVGPMPSAIQALNKRIFQEWIPGNLEYTIETGIFIEKYSAGDVKLKDYVSEIWIPVKKKIYSGQ